MSGLLWGGAALAAIGIAGLAWCILRAARLRREETDAAETRRVLNGLVAANFASVGCAFLGLALMVAGALL